MGIYCDRFKRDLKIRGSSPKTVYRYIGCVSTFFKHIKLPPAKVRLEDINQYQLYLTEERKVAPSTFNVHVFAIRFFFLITLKRPWKIKFVPYQKDRRKLPEIFNALELSILFKSISNIKHMTILMTIYSAGLRISEALHLKVSDIDSQRMVIRIDQGKGCKDRYVPLSETLLPILRAYWKHLRPSNWLFEGQNPQRPLGKETVQEVFRNQIKKVGITKKVTVHSLRHSFASHLLEHGVDIRTIQQLLGHKTLVSTMIYTHVAKNYVHQAGSPLDRIEGIDSLLPLPPK